MTAPDTPGPSLRTLVAQALAEDVHEGDLTSLWTVPSEHRTRAVVVAKEELVVAGTECVQAVMGQVDPGIRVELRTPDGTSAMPGDVLLELDGFTGPLLAGERTALNFLGRLSGIATLTRRFVEAVEGTDARIVDTRKTTPGWRVLDKAAVRAGGGTNHRMGLWDMVLVKDNHVDAAGGVEAAARAALEGNERRVRQGLPPVEIEVEVRTLDELDEVLPLGVDRVLLDNMEPDTLREAVARTDAAGARRPLLEASGNVSLATVRAVAETGVDLISVGALTHSAPSADVSLRVLRNP